MSMSAGFVPNTKGTGIRLENTLIARPYVYKGAGFYLKGRQDMQLTGGDTKGFIEQGVDCVLVIGSSGT